MRIIDADAAKTNVRATFLGASDFAADVRNACCAAIDKAPTVTGNAAAANVPLSAEQLRDMGGMPYWHDSLDGNIGHWAILDPQVALHPEDYHYGETWIAYAMMDTAISGSGEKGCEICDKNESDPIKWTQSGDPHPFNARFCPNCGKILPKVHI